MMPDQTNKSHDSEEDSGQSPQKEFRGIVQIPEDDRRTHVNKYTKAADFPFEQSETVWIVKPGWRAPLGEFVITKAHPKDFFELKNKENGTAHPELEEGKHLRRYPFGPVAL